MNVAELRKRLEAYDDETEVNVQDAEERLFELHPVLGEANEGEIVVIMAGFLKPDGTSASQWSAPNGGDPR